MSTAVLLLVLSLAQARLTWLVVDDEITKSVRLWTVRRWGEGGMIPYLLHCPWCSGLWISTLLCVFAWLTSLCSLTVAVLLVPATAYGGALVRAMIEE